MTDRSKPAPGELMRRYGPVALMTGASDGIGRAFARRLAAAGFDLILVTRREAALEAVAREIGADFGVEARIVPLDLGDPGAVRHLLEATAGQPVGLVVAAAGHGSVGPFRERDLADELGMIDVNCRSVVDLAHGFGRRMAAEGRGGMILFGSRVGFQGAPWAATCAATKGVVQSLAEALAVEPGGRGVSVLSVAPEPVGTGLAARAGMRMGRAERPDTVARGALAALAWRGTVRPGFLSKLMGWSLAALPRAGRVRCRA